VLHSKIQIFVEGVASFTAYESNIPFWVTVIDCQATYTFDTCIITYLQFFYSTFSYSARNENGRQCFAPDIGRFNNTLNFVNSWNPVKGISSGLGQDPFNLFPFRGASFISKSSLTALRALPTVPAVISPFSDLQFSAETYEIRP
jgi:hypothetical protein